MRSALACIVLSGGLVLGIASCAKPRVITSITGTDTQMKFVYTRAAGFFDSGGTGVIQCAVTPEGDLADCKPIPITFNDE